MPQIAQRPTGTFILNNENRECEIITAGKDPVFGEIGKPDQFTAYGIVRFGKSLPMVVGPESRNGQVFGMHPAVVARSFESMRHKQTNLGHQLKAFGSKKDRIMGCVLQCAFPEEPDGGWGIPATVEEAPSIRAMCAIFKQAEGVDKLLGNHLSGKVPMSVSMEFTYYLDQMGLYDPSTGECYDRADIPQSLKGYVYEDDKGRLMIRPNIGKKLVIALGGLNGRVWYSGVGYTDNPAEETAGIESIAAERRQGMMVCELGATPEWLPGMAAKWPGGEYGRGIVLAVHQSGEQALHGKRLFATAEAPVLRIKLPNGVAILRRASSVTKKILNS